jgi:hypothetical protein
MLVTGQVPTGVFFLATGVLGIVFAAWRKYTKQRPKGWSGYPADPKQLVGGGVFALGMTAGAIYGGLWSLAEGGTGNVVYGVLLLLLVPFTLSLAAIPFVFLVAARRPLEKRSRLTLRLFPILREPPASHDGTEPS